jgi:hypothetical protein
MASLPYVPTSPTANVPELVNVCIVYIPEMVFVPPLALTPESLSGKAPKPLML